MARDLNDRAGPRDPKYPVSAFLPTAPVDRNYALVLLAGQKSSPNLYLDAENS
jgi:hypothetical protein